jgi:hypothetical protein
MTFSNDKETKSFPFTAKATYIVKNDRIFISEQSSKENVKNIGNITSRGKTKESGYLKSFSLELQFEDSKSATAFYNQMLISLDSCVRPSQDSIGSGCVTIQHDVN